MYQHPDGLTFEVGESVRVNLESQYGNGSPTARYQMYHGKLAKIHSISRSDEDTFYYVNMDMCGSKVDFWPMHLNPAEEQMTFPFMGDGNA